METANLGRATDPCIHLESGLVPRPRLGASARCRFQAPWRGSISVIWFGAPFSFMDHRLLVLFTSAVAAIANVGTIVFLILAGQTDSIGWPILASAVAGVATLSVIATHAVLPKVQPAASTPQPPQPTSERVADRTTELRLVEASLDGPLRNKALMNLVEECVSLFDELERLRPGLDTSSQDFADHLGCRLQEILERSDVTIITGEAAFDRHRHQHASPDATVADGTPIAETQSPGFAVGRRVFRRARVKLAEVASIEKGPST
jgi:hypothetical protein